MHEYWTEHKQMQTCGLFKLSFSMIKNVIKNNSTQINTDLLTRSSKASSTIPGIIRLDNNFTKKVKKVSICQTVLDSVRDVQQNKDANYWINR